jgi:hypothetical protein
LGKAKLKNVKEPVEIHALQGSGLPEPNMKRFNELANPKKKLAVVPTVIIFLLLLTSIIYFTVNYFKDEAIRKDTINYLPEIEALVNASWRDYSKAYDLAIKAKEILPKNSRLQTLIDQSSISISVNTEPSGATVYVKKYDQPESPWEEVGVTPIDSLRLPISVFRWRFEKEGYETALAAATNFDWKDFTDMRKINLYTPNNLFRTLDKIGEIPGGMTRVNGSRMPYGEIHDFLIDKYEVTNIEYKKFVDAGGYTNRDFWTEEFIKDNVKTSWEEAVELFVDRTGQPGPSTWENGSYPIGKENYPVTGVSWYEAKAFAEYVGKDLPTGDHWGLARGENTFLIRWPQMGGYAIFAPYSNFSQEGPVEVGILDGITSFGTFDMAGNVNEWCLNETEAGRLYRGGAWNSNTYMFGNLMQSLPMDRGETMGFRCAKYINPQPLPANVFRQTLGNEIFPLDPIIPESAPDEIFEVYKSFYDYDKTELNSNLIFRNEHENWIHEKVIFEAAYNNEQVITHIFLPVDSKAPFQSVIYGPGDASFFQSNSDSISSYYEFPVFLEHYIKAGRAVIYPVIQGTFERGSDDIAFIRLGSETQQFTEFITQVIKDYRRTIDYIESRTDFDHDKIAFSGMSWGPIVGSILSSLESRIKTNIFVSGGLHLTGKPEVNLINFITRVKVPTLMINGRYDSVFPLEFNIEPMFQRISVPDNQKKLVLYDTDHIPPREGMIKESLEWLDKHLGEVQAIGT